MKLIVGLGNPGKRYAKTRHNVGFCVLDALAQREALSWSDQADRGHVATWNNKSGKIILLKPQTFMNLSGEAVASLARYHRVEPDEILIVHDDLDLPLGRLRLVRSGSPAGHNGIKSIIQHLGTDLFPRLKIGIGRPVHPGQEVADFVLSGFHGDDLVQIGLVQDRALLAIDAVIDDGLDVAMNQFNTK